MFKQEHDQISISISESCASGNSPPENDDNIRKSENEEDEQVEENQNDQYYGVEWNNTGSTTNNVTINNPTNPTVGDLHNFYGPVTLIMHPKTDNLVQEMFQKSEKSKIPLKNEPEIVEAANFEKETLGM